MNRNRLAAMAGCTLGALIGMLAVAGPATASAGTTCETVQIMTGHNTYETECASSPAVAPAVPETVPVQNACSAYVYTGTSTNLCGAFAGRDKLNCSDVKFRVTLTNKDVDPWGLDGSTGTKGIGCEGYPLKQIPVPTKTTSKPATHKPTTKPATHKPTTKPATRKPTTTPSATPTHSPTPSHTAVAGIGSGPQLPLTGPGPGVFVTIGLGAMVAAAGLGLFMLAYRRRMRFTA